MFNIYYSFNLIDNINPPIIAVQNENFCTWSIQVLVSKNFIHFLNLYKCLRNKSYNFRIMFVSAMHLDKL